MFRHRLLALVALVSTATLAGCTSAASTGSTGATRTLTLAYFDGNTDFDPALDWFTNAVTDVSHGKLTVAVRWSCCQPTTATAGAEGAIIDQVGQNRYDLGVVGVRALDVAGVTTLDGLLAPLQVNSYAEQAAVLDDKVVRDAAGSVTKVGTGRASVVGLLPGPERYPVSLDVPILGLDDWKGKAIYTVPNHVQEATVAAFGAKVFSEGERDALITQGALAGTENSVPWGGDDLTITKSLTANVGLWPNPKTVLISPKARDALTEQQRGWIAQAARETVGLTEKLGDYDAFITQVCSFPDVVAPPDAVAGLVAAVRPVHDQLADDPKAARVLTRVDELAGPPGAATPPPSC